MVPMAVLNKRMRIMKKFDFKSRTPFENAHRLSEQEPMVELNKAANHVFKIPQHLANVAKAIVDDSKNKGLDPDAFLSEIFFQILAEQETPNEIH